MHSFGIKYIHRAIAALPVALLFLGCSSAPKSYGIKGEGDSVLNRDVNGRSLSVVVRVYQLRDPREFAKLTFDTLADGRPESELLGPALLDKTDVIIVPGGSYVNSEKLHDETRFVGIVGFFRRPDAYYWRQLVDADTIRKQGLKFRVQDCYVVVGGGIQPVPIPGQPPGARPECDAAPHPIARTPARTAPSSPQQAQPLNQPGRPAPYAQPVPAYTQPYPQPAPTYAQPSPQPTQPYGSAPQPYGPAPQAGSYAPASTAQSGQQRSWLPQGMPDVNVTANTPLAPANVRIGGGGSSVTFGEQAPPVANYPAQPYYGPQPYYGQPVHGPSPYSQPAYPAPNPTGAPRY